MPESSDGRKVIRVVLDTNCYVNALLSEKSASAAILASFLAGKIHNFYTVQIINELKAVLLSEFDFNVDKIEYFEDIIKSCSFQIEQSPEFEVEICRDYTDNKFLSIAKQVDADFLITFDKDLLILKNIGRTRILTPGEYLKLVF